MSNALAFRDVHPQHTNILFISFRLTPTSHYRRLLVPAALSTLYISFYYNIFSPVICVRVRGIPSNRLLYPANPADSGIIPRTSLTAATPSPHSVHSESLNLLPSSFRQDEKKHLCTHAGT